MGILQKKEFRYAMAEQGGEIGYCRFMMAEDQKAMREKVAF